MTSPITGRGCRRASGPTLYPLFTTKSQGTAWDCPSANGSSPSTAASSGSRANSAKARASRSISPSVPTQANDDNHLDKKRASATSLAAVTSHATTTPFGTPPGTILIADDEELIRRVLADTLRDQGHTVQTVDNGALAWEALTTKAFDWPCSTSACRSAPVSISFSRPSKNPARPPAAHADHHHDRPDHP